MDVWPRMASILMAHIHFELPFPPSANRYWRWTNMGPRVSKHCLDYRETVAAACWQYRMMTARLRVSINLYPPDGRRRDIDNYAKPLLDALEHAHVYADDEQIDDLRITRDEIVKDGKVEVLIEEIE